MGEARRRREALAAFQPLPQDHHVCPVCRGRNTRVETMPAQLAMSHVATPVGVCGDCRALWEAYPPDWSHDAVEAAPCDNCAFAKGSPESADREGWTELLANLKDGNVFNCHKGAPIIVGPDGKVEFDEAWVTRHGRTCAGFVRALQRWPDWFDKRLKRLGIEPARAPEEPAADA